MTYKLAYRFGFHPWEEALHQKPFVASLSQLLDAEERGREKPYGRALDLGTGSGIWAVELARRGWDVTGVDIVDNALERAERDVPLPLIDAFTVPGALGVADEKDRRYHERSS